MRYPFLALSLGAASAWASVFSSGCSDSSGSAATPRLDVDWGSADGLRGPILDVSADEAGNLWAISADTLFLLTPTASRFVAFGNAEGLHVEHFTAFDGSSQVTSLTAIAGGAANQVFVGYLGYESPDPTVDTLAQRALGNADRVSYDPTSGRIQVVRYQLHCTYDSAHCWENRSVRRLVYAHSGAAAGHLFLGGNHGADHLRDDAIGDHVHPETQWVMGAQRQEHLGEQRGIAVADDGGLWVASRYGVGQMNWNPDPVGWVSARFRIAFSTYTADHALDEPWGYTEDNRGAAVASDDTVWLASHNHGLTSWNPHTSMSTMKHWATTGGLPASGLADVAADADGSVWLVLDSGALLHFLPSTGTVMTTTITDARRVVLDRRSTPRALYVARVGGVSVRGL
jgi:hypothetical protein